MKSTTITAFVMGLLCFFNSPLLLATGLFTELSLQDKTQISQYIVEGQVLSQESFWDSEHNQILTAYELLVYKSFKAELPSDHIWIITDGGTVGDDMHKVFPEFHTKTGDLGLFFIKENPVSKKWENQEDNLQFRLISNNQAAIKYDLRREKAVDHFQVYNDISKDLYKTISKQISREYTVWNNLPSTGKKDEGAPLKTVDGMVDCIYPNVVIAGNDAVLTITGEGFGALGLDSKVSLPDPSTGGLTRMVIDQENIIHWDNHSIEIRIPDNVGTGTVLIENSLGQSIESSLEVYVKYAVNTAGSDQTPSMLVNQNGMGGYDFLYSTNAEFGGESFSGSPAEAPFERALERLQMEVGFNAVIAGVTEDNFISNDGKNIIMFDNDNEVLASAGLLHSQYSRCGGMWEAVGMDIVFRRNNTGDPSVIWNYGSGDPAWNQLDFESVAIHELMHGVQVKHNMQEESLMYYAYTFGDHKRQLHACLDKSAAQMVNDRSIIYSPYCDGASTYVLHTDFLGYNLDYVNCITETECGTNAIGEMDPRIRVTVLLEGYMNETGGMFNILNAYNLLPNEQPFNIKPWFYEGTESVNGMPYNTTDWVLVSLHDSEDPNVTVARRAALLDRAGNITDLEGNIGVPFEGVTSGEFYISVRHCSHLAVLSNSSIHFPNAVSYDFTDDVEKAMGYLQQAKVGDKFTMISGDYDGNGIINNLDFNRWNLENALVDKYVPWDGDGNGVVNNIDYNIWNANRSKIGIGYIHQ